MFLCIIFLQILSWCEAGECQDTAKASCSLQLGERGDKRDDKESRARALCYRSEPSRTNLGMAAQDSPEPRLCVGMRLV